MNNPLHRLARRYAATLRKYLADEPEAVLEQAYELGRTAIAQGFGVLDMVRIHQEALRHLLRSRAGRKDNGRVMEAAETFLLESFSPFEATHRGFCETNVKLQERNRELEAEIHERKRTEAALRESERRYSTLIETADDVIFSLTPKGRIAAVNHAFEAITGWRRAAWLGKPFAALIHPEDVGVAVDRFYAILRGMPPERWAYRVRKADGQYAVGEFTLTQEIKDGRCVGIFGIGRDITERKRAEAALRESEERFRLMVAAVKDYVICMLDPTGRVASWNPGAERITGYRADEVLGLPASTFYPPEEIARGTPERTIEMVRRTGHAGEEGWRVRKDGSRFLVSAALTAIWDAEGNLRGFVNVARDITERKRAEEALQQSEKHYHRLFNEAQAMQENLRNLSNKILRTQEEERKRISRELHDEVGQSLTAISVTLATLKNSAAGSSNGGSRKLAEAQGLLQETMETVHRFARDLRPALLDELGLVPALRSYLKGFAGRTGLHVHFYGNPIAEKLTAEQKTVVFRIAQESLTNVSKHAHASQVAVAIRKLNDGVCMEVTDNGCSFKENPVDSGRSKGRLGLLGMQERVRLVNGQFSIRPQPGKGTTVQVRVPFSRTGAAMPAQPTRDRPAGEGRSVRAQTRFLSHKKQPGVHYGKNQSSAR